jgi:hypothetical protein
VLGEVQVFGHVTLWPQLLTAGPQALPEQVIVWLLGVHPHALAVAPPPPQVLGEVQVFGHVTV